MTGQKPSILPIDNPLTQAYYIGFAIVALVLIYSFNRQAGETLGIAMIIGILGYRIQDVK
jgi:hypothetical protein